MIPSERFAKIEELVARNEFVSTRELALSLGVTETTIRRDCEELEQQGALLRVHGGAKSLKRKAIVSNRNEISMTMKRTKHAEEKAMVCKKAASFVKDGDCIFLDGGTSITPIAEYLHDKKIKVVTNNLYLNADSLGEEIELFYLGGRYIADYGMNAGPLTQMELECFSFDYAFISCVGVDPLDHMVYTAEMDTTAIKKKAMERSVISYLLTDSSKLSVKGFCGMLKTDDFEAVISNQDGLIEEDTLPENFILVENIEE